MSKNQIKNQKLNESIDCYPLLIKIIENSEDLKQIEELHKIEQNVVVKDGFKDGFKNGFKDGFKRVKRASKEE